MSKIIKKTKVAKSSDAKKVTAKNKGGRPKIPFEDSYIDILVSRMREGQSVFSVCRELKVSFSTFERWLRENVEFSEAYSLAKTFCQGWWSEQARINLGQRGFQSTLWLMNMRNRFKWQEGKPHFPLVNIFGFEKASLKDKAEACAKAVADKKISADHYLVLMQGLQAHAQIIDKTETADRLESLEKFIRGDREEAVNFPTATQQGVVA